MIYVCELFTDEPEGGSAMIPLKRFIDLYTFLADLHCSDVPLPDDEGKKKEEDECDSSVDRDFPDPSKVALPGSRDELSEDSTEVSNNYNSNNAGSTSYLENNNFSNSEELRALRTGARIIVGFRLVEK